MLLWVHRVEAERAQKSSLNYIKETKNYDTVGQNMQKQDHATPRIHKWRTDVNTVAEGTHPSNALHMTKMYWV